MPNTPKQKKLEVSKEKPAPKTLEAKSNQRVFSQPLGKTPSGKKIPPNMVIAGGVIIVLVLAVAGYYYFLQNPITPAPPTPPATPPTSSLAWFSIEPVQCQGNAWNQWFAQ